MKKEKIIQIFEELEKSTSPEELDFKVLKENMFLVFNTRNKELGYACKINDDEIFEVLENKNIYIAPIELNGHTCIYLVLKDAHFKSTFFDLVSLFLNLPENIKLGNRKNFILNKIENWQKFLEDAKTKKLNKNTLRGLYGELYLVDILLENNIFKLDNWVGFKKEEAAAKQDFHYPKTAIEVKTSKQSNPKFIKISDERQLDKGSFENLFLFFLSINENEHSGETIAQLVAKIKQKLETPSDEHIFSLNLFEYGFTNEPSASNIRYSVRSSQFYNAASDKFPKILERFLMPGVGNVSYSISLDVCNDQKVENSEVFNHLD